MKSTTSLKLPHELKDKISSLAEGVEQTPHAYMVEAIAEKVARDEKRRAFYEAADRSFKHYKDTGIAYTHDSVMKYMLDKAAGKKPRKPKPIKIPRARR